MNLRNLAIIGAVLLALVGTYVVLNRGGTLQNAAVPGAAAPANASGTAAHFRLHDSGGTVCHMQGSVGLGAGDLSLDNNVIVAGQPITINTFTLTDGNA